MCNINSDEDETVSSHRSPVSVFSIDELVIFVSSNPELRRSDGYHSWAQRSYGMTGDYHGNIVAFSSKIAVEQAGDETGMSPTKPGIIVKGVQ